MNKKANFDICIICNRCRCEFYREQRAEATKPEASSVQMEGHDLQTSKPCLASPKRICLSIPRTSLSHNKCQFCKGTDDLKNISKEIRLKTFIDSGTLIPDGARCCKRHLTDDGVNADVMKRLLPTSDFTNFNRTEITSMLNSLREKCKERTNGVDFDDQAALSDEDYYNLTGVTKAQFDTLCSYLTPLRDSNNRSSRTCLALLLTKLRTGNSLSFLSSMFQIKNKSVISRSIASARNALMEHFVPRYLGFEHITMEDFISEHTRPFAQHLLADGKQIAILVLDGTYVYIQKSGNYSFQRQTFSGHKHRPLEKPMMIVGTDGYILAVLGPYLADGRNNDAAILKSIIKQNVDEIQTWLERDDLLVVDRGFRDSIGFLDSLGINSEMPDYLSRGSKQHTTEEANHSRCVTKVRWVVESANGRIKKWKALDQVFPNCQIKWIGDSVRIVCAIVNAFRPPLVCEENNDIALANTMKVLSRTSNELQKRVEKEKLASRRVVWTEMSQDCLQNFPRLTEIDLRTLTLGVYQITQAKSYTQEHLSPDGTYSISIHKDDAGLLRARIQSRHVSAKRYFLWISFDETSTPPITGWYCQCKVGARTVGCCAHIAAVIWYLGFQRHSVDRLLTPTDYKEFILDAPDTDWDSDDESLE
ncbi:uncharacterized protein LOC134242456 [Saccostrea cucullata]|uniref:uncharacterized protein LOC134242456 n=1 Tax=Saccostrea cuccullata TaxID=36930 RepID=UPI002ED1C504